MNRSIVLKRSEAGLGEKFLNAERSAANQKRLAILKERESK
jgi:hypothetical protein